MANLPLNGREAFPRRDNFMDMSVEVWKEDKSVMDQKYFKFQAQYWCYKNKIYDLSDFIKTHPGGAHWLEMTRGSDITDFVETHHLNIGKIEEILKKYYVKESENRVDFFRFEWSEKTLYSSIRKRVVSYLKERGQGGNMQVKLQYFLLIFSFFACFFWLYKSQSQIIAFITGIFCFAMLGVGHNFIHQKTSLLRFCADVTLFGSYQWTVSHALSHHTYTNLEIDIEIQAMEPFIYYLANKPKNPAINVVFGHLLFIFLGVLNYIRRFLFFFVGKDKLQPENVIPLIELVILWTNAEGFGSALKLWLIMHSVASFQMILATFPNHRTENHWSEGEPNAVKCFAEHTILTTSDHSVKLPLIFAYLCFGGFNDHILHHLFPTIDRSLIPELKHILIEECKKFGIVYKESNFFENLKGVYVAFFRDKPYYQGIKKNN